ncbi:DNA translocase FtsK 4TM domain-containing protein, partial [Bosea sp. (in: a-proteobacteria)]|uniref:DNA translocase FtsK 4TM domain-containing protein n=1 Tax=Bosea sp. (in: a-proteobacteria) TaxID=1871050 RepID=UPI002FCB0368
MRTIRRSSSLIDRLPDPVREFLSRRAAEIAGLVLLALTAAVAIALATWSVDDPSLNNATRGAVRNLLGRPGAMVADLTMQLIGIGVIAMLLPPLLWALRLVRVHLFDRSALKLALWVAGIVATAAVASALPATPRWPLPTGMGGVIGDALLHGTRNLVGLSGTALGGLVAFVYAGIAILAVTAAAGFGFVVDEDPETDADDDAAWSDSDDRRDDEPGFAVILIGWLAHGAMSLRGAILRRLPQPPPLARASATPAA